MTDCVSDFYTFIQLVKIGNIDNVKLYFKLEYLEMSHKYEMRPIHYACQCGHIKSARFLIENNCNINVSDYWGEQPIHYACQNGYNGIVKLLLAHKCNAEACNNKGVRPIHHACLYGHVETVRLLLAHKCDIEACNNQGMRPIHYACNYGHKEIVKLLMLNDCKIEDCYDELTEIAKKSQKFIDLLSGSMKNRCMSKVAMAMSLECDLCCSHDHCLISLSITNLKDKGVLIGSGAFGFIYKYEEFQRKFATKLIKINPTPIVKKETKKIEENINEFRHLLRHENIVEYFGAVEESHEMMIFMEYVNGKSLQDQIGECGALPHETIAKYCKQILLGIAYLHKNKIIHRDVKPANILLDSNNLVKLCDFGISRSLMTISTIETQNAITICGTPNYTAPEVINDEPYRYPADIWSVGATVVEMLTGYPPFYGTAQFALILKISQLKTIEFKPVLPMSDCLNSFVYQMLQSEQSKRPSAKDLLKHKVFDL